MHAIGPIIDKTHDHRLEKDFTISNRRLNIDCKWSACSHCLIECVESEEGNCFQIASRSGYANSIRWTGQYTVCVEHARRDGIKGKARIRKCNNHPLDHRQTQPVIELLNFASLWHFGKQMANTCQQLVGSANAIVVQHHHKLRRLLAMGKLMDPLCSHILHFSCACECTTK